MFDFNKNAGNWSPGDFQFNPPDLSRIGKFAIGIFLIVIFFVGLNFFRGIYTDWLWFDNLGYKGVFLKILTTKLWLFSLGAIFFAFISSVNLVLAHRFSKGTVSLSLPPSSIESIRKLIVWALGLVIAVLSVVFGFIAMGRWESFLRFFNSVPFDINDPQFNKDIAFYVFDLPIFHFIQGWLLGAVIVTLVAVVGLYFINFSLRGMKFSFSTPVKTHISILGTILMFLIAWSHWLDRWEILYSNAGAIFGAGYADVNARLPVLILLTAVAVISGILMLVSAYLKNIKILLGAFGVWVALAILGGGVVPSMVQRFSVNPNEFVREQEYIQRNIDFTREGFALNRIEEGTFPAELSIDAKTISENRPTVDNIRVWDHRPLMDSYNQIQFIRLYYDFLDVDVDRYLIDGEYKQVMLSARELSQEKLPEEAQRWVNQKLQYTHGFGVAMSPVTEFSEEGRPDFYIQDIPPSNEYFNIDNPRIYYGENTKDFVVVNSNTKEFDYPTEGESGVYKNYEGKGGVNLNSIVTRAAYAWQFTDVNLFISGEITDGSRIQYRREITDRIKTIAPFLLLDADPYLVVSDSGLYWIQDAYTHTDRYPYSEPYYDSFNYVRNSVKIVIDAYHGSVDFYVFDETDPLVGMYQQAFPKLFKPKAQMPSDLKSHIRYPSDFLKWQAEKYLTYHMQNTQVFYNKEDKWSLPTELFYESFQEMEPYYLIMNLPGEEKEEFVLLIPFTPANKPNLVAWLAARSDGDNYGKLKAFLFPKDRQVYGPSQIEARIDNDPYISQQFTLWGQVGSTVIRGNLLVIPIGESILYIEPVFLQAKALDFPELKRVIAVSGDQVVMEKTLEDAIEALVGPTKSKSSLDDKIKPSQTLDSEPENVSESIQEFLNSLNALKGDITTLEEALKKIESFTNQK